MQPEQQWLITMIAIASVTILALVLFVLLCRQWRNDNPVMVLDEKSDTTAASLPIVIALAGATEVSNMTSTDDDDSCITTTPYDWPPVVIKTSLRCPKLDYPSSKFDQASVASIDTPLPRYLQLNVSGQLKSSSMDESSIVRNMKAALAGLRGEPSCEASEI